MAIYIYTLRHPETHQIHYVGKTNALRMRRKNHEKPSGRSTRVGEWVKSLRQAGMRPVMEAIEEVILPTDWHERERYWIDYYRALSCDLLNVATGGGGCVTHTVAESTRERLRRAFKGRPIPPEQRAQISKSLTGKKQSPETAAKRRATTNANRAANGLQPWNFGRDKSVYKARERARSQAAGAVVMGSPEWKEKIRQALAKRAATLTDEERRVMASHLHDPNRPLIRKKCVSRGPMSEEQKQKIRESVKRTKELQAAVRTPEEKRQLFAHLYARHGPVSEATKEKIRQTLLKRNAALTPEERQRIATAHKYGPMSEETKQKIRESVTRTKALRKQAG